MIWAQGRETVQTSDHSTSEKFLSAFQNVIILGILKPEGGLGNVQTGKEEEEEDVVRVASRFCESKVIWGFVQKGSALSLRTAQHPTHCPLESSAECVAFITLLEWLQRLQGSREPRLNSLLNDLVSYHLHRAWKYRAWIWSFFMLHISDILTTSPGGKIIT